MHKYDTLADEFLISEYRKDSTDVMDYLMEKYKPMVRRKARAMYLLGGENEDLIQEGMIGLMKAVRSFDDSQGASFASFAELCVSRQMYSAIEASKRKKHMPLNSYVSIYEENDNGEDVQLPLIDTIEGSREDDPEVMYFGRQYVEAMIEKLQDSLSPMENHVLYLHMMGIDYRRIAEILEKSPKSIDNALQRIRGKAEKLLNRKRGL